MIDAGVLYLILAMLILSVVLNLALTLRLNRSVRKLAEAIPPVLLQVGDTVPSIKGRPLSHGEPLVVSGGGAPTALLFLSSSCPKCRDKLPEIARLLPLAEEAGLAIRLVSMEPAWRWRRFLRQGGLLLASVRVNRRDYLALNPLLATPAYLFVDDAGTLEAAGIVGDENWLGLCQQLSPADLPDEEVA